MASLNNEDKMLRSEPLFFIVYLLFSPLCFGNIQRETPVLIGTLPKSGTCYIRQVLTNAFGDVDAGPKVSTQNRVQDIGLCQYKESGLIDFVHNGSFALTHNTMSENSIEICKKYPLRFIANCRDPREALISWAFHYEKYYQDPTLRAVNNKASWIAPNQYPLWTFEQKLDWHIDTYYKYAIEWISAWIEAEKNPELEVLILTNKELREQPLQYFASVFAFNEITLETSIQSLLPPVQIGTLHIRKNDPNEWKRLLSAEQQANVNQMLTVEIIERLDLD